MMEREKCLHGVGSTVQPSSVIVRTALAREGSTGCGTRKSFQRFRRLRSAGLSTIEECLLEPVRVCNSEKMLRVPVLN